MSTVSGKRLRYLRSKKKMTQEEVAKELGITRPAYTQYEKETRTPDAETLVRIADLYEVSTDFLLGRTNDPVEIHNSQEPTDEELERMQIAAHMEHVYGDTDPDFTKFVQKIIGQVREEYDRIKKQNKGSD